MSYTQENKSIVIDTPLGGNELMLTRFSGTEGISALFSFELEMLSENQEIAFDKIIGEAVTVSIILADGDSRFFNGIVSRFSQGSGGGESGGNTRFSHYTATMVPWLWLLTRTVDSRIFQQLSVPDIIEKIFKEKGFSDYKIALHDSYDKKDYCVQYRETDFDFISRLMEQEGIYYFFEHEEKKHTLILSDSPDEHKPCPKQESARCQASTGGWLEEDVITELTWQQEIRIGKYTVNDYNFEVPNTDLKVEASTRHPLGPGEREVYDAPARYAKRSEGDRVANIRMQEEEARITSITGAGDCRAFASGYRFDLLDYHRADMNEKSYVLTSVNHNAFEPAGVSGHESKASYTNRFTCIPFEVPYRPQRTTPRPVLESAQTATVVGPAGEEIYPDRYGRVKVQFPWDREGKKDENSSCWIRVSQPWAGAGWGAMFIPHVGQEVIVNFVEGDPDRPIITGRVYHGTNMPADTLPDEKTKSVIRSRQDNDIIIEDKEGDRHIHLKQACGNEIIMHESSPDIEIKQECGNKVHMKASGPDIEITQACGNEILMREAEGIQIRDKYGNEVVLDAAAGFMRLASPSNNSYIELGKSIVSYTDSNGVKITQGDSEEEVYGNSKKLTIGHTSEKFGGTKQSYNLAVTEDFFVGAKFSQMTGIEVKTNISKEISKNVLDRVRKSKGNIKYDSEKAIELIGGSGDEGQLVLDKDGAWIGCKGSEIDVDQGSDININAKQDINLKANGMILVSAKGNLTIKSNGIQTFDAKGNLIKIG